MTVLFTHTNKKAGLHFASYNYQQILFDKEI